MRKTLKSFYCGNWEYRTYVKVHMDNVSSDLVKMLEISKKIKIKSSHLAKSGITESAQLAFSNADKKATMFYEKYKNKNAPTVIIEKDESFVIIATPIRSTRIKYDFGIHEELIKSLGFKSAMVKEFNSIEIANVNKRELTYKENNLMKADCVKNNANSYETLSKFLFLSFTWGRGHIPIRVMSGFYQMTKAYEGKEITLSVAREAIRQIKKEYSIR